MKMRFLLMLISLMGFSTSFAWGYNLYLKNAELLYEHYYGLRYSFHTPGSLSVFFQFPVTSDGSQENNFEIFIDCERETFQHSGYKSKIPPNVGISFSNLVLSVKDFRVGCEGKNAFAQSPDFLLTMRAMTDGGLSLGTWEKSHFILLTKTGIPDVTSGEFRGSIYTEFSLDHNRVSAKF